LASSADIGHRRSDGSGVVRVGYSSCGSWTAVDPMNSDAERYQWTFDKVTGEPIGVLDTWYSPQGAEGVQVGSEGQEHPQVPAVYQPPQPIQVYQPAPQVYSPQPQYYYRRPGMRMGSRGGSRVVFYVVAAIFAAGLYVGFLVFGGRTQPPPVVLVCTSASSYPFTPAQGVAAPASCAPAPKNGASR
jgi:hypothetical protein